MMSNGYDLDPALAKEALTVQDACNLSGVVFSMARAMERICADARREGKGTDWKNHHPIAVLYADKVADLAGCSRSLAYHDAYAACRKATKRLDRMGASG